MAPAAEPATAAAHEATPAPVPQRFARLRDLAAMAPLQVLRELGSSLHGLDEGEAQRRLATRGENVLLAAPPRGYLARALADPFVVVLLLVGVVSAVSGDPATVTVVAVLASVACGLRVSQEYRAGRAAAALRGLAATTTTVLRRAAPAVPAIARELPTDQLVPGDVIQLAGGDAVPADVRLLRSTGLTVSQALLTGESLPVAKHATLTDTGSLADTAPVDHPRLCLRGATVVGGRATGVVVATGTDTYFAAGDHDLPSRRGRSAFDRGVTAVSWTLIRLMLAAVPLVLLLTGFTRDTWVQAGLFAAAAAVGLVPGMLPVVTTTALIRAHAVLRGRGVVAKRLPAIHNLGAMDVLCIDKTGTLTLDRLSVTCYLDPLGRPDPQPLRHAYLAARFGIEHTDPPVPDAVDEALLHRAGQLDLAGDDGLSGIDALPLDASRRRTTVALRQAGRWGQELLITKGAAEDVLDCCARARIGGRDVALDAGQRHRLRRLADRLHADGTRVLAVAVRTRPVRGRRLRPADEAGLTLLGYVGLLDEAKPSAAGTLAALGRRTTVFARVDAGQKARIVAALKAAGHTVGYLGDGVNDVPALHAADVGACVEGAAEIAQEFSDVVLVGKDLAILAGAVSTARHAFGNIVKYVKITVSANVGNVCAALAASATLPFLPMLPMQILVQNLLFDVSQLSLAFDRTDPDRRPRTFDTRDLSRFVLCFGAVNALADLATFAALRHTAGAALSPAAQALFHTGWFVENLLTQAVAVHLLRSRTRSWAARPVLLTTAGIVLFTAGLVVGPAAGSPGLHALPAAYRVWLGFFRLSLAACRLLIRSCSGLVPPPIASPVTRMSSACRMPAAFSVPAQVPSAESPSDCSPMTCMRYSPSVALSSRPIPVASAQYATALSARRWSSSACAAAASLTAALRHTDGASSGDTFNTSASACRMVPASRPPASTAASTAFFNRSCAVATPSAAALRRNAPRPAGWSLALPCRSSAARQASTRSVSVAGSASSEVPSRFTAHATLALRCWECRLVLKKNDDTGSSSRSTP